MPDDTIINKVISFIAGGNEGGDDKQILLKQLAREVQQNKYAKFYRPRQEEADPSFAQYFYNLYKIIYPARSFLKNPATMAKIQQITLESSLDKATMDVIKRLGPEAIEERKKNAAADFPEELEKDIESLTQGFDSPRLAAADKCYNLIFVFNRFVSWDFFALLKKFDPDITEGFPVPPKFSPLRTDVIMADIASLLSIIPVYDPQDDWKTVLEIFKYCRGGSALIPLETWTGLLADLKDLRQSKILETMVKLASGNPIWELKPASFPDEQLSSSWLTEKTTEIRRIISDITESQKNSQIAALVKAIFGNMETVKLHYYTKDRGKILAEKELDTYIYASALNHLLLFIQEFISKEMYELADILLVRGQWTKNAESISMSDAYHVIMDIAPEITDLDELLSEDGGEGSRLRGALLRVDRDRSQTRYLNSLVHSINQKALNIINRAVPNLVVIGRHLKKLVDDCQKKPYDLIMNWKELIQISKIPMAQRLNDDYKRINYFIQLMNLEGKPEGESEEE